MADFLRTRTHRIRWGILPTLLGLLAALALGSCETLWILEVEITGEGIGRVRSVNGLFLCQQLERGVSRTCLENYREGLTLQLEVDDEDAEFLGWGGACTGTDRTCTVDLTQDRNVRANFRARTFGVSVTSGGDGSGRVFGAGFDCTVNGPTVFGICQLDFVKDSTITLTSSALAGSRIEGNGWLGCNEVRTSDGACVVVVDEPRVIQAIFVRTERTLRVEGGGAGSGIVTSNPSGINCSIEDGVAAGGICATGFPIGTSVTLTPHPSSDSEFDEWIGACTGAGSCTFSMDADRTVTVVFGEAARTLGIEASGVGSGRITSVPAGIDCTVENGALGTDPGNLCTATFDHGTDVELEAEAADGSTFEGWGGCDSTEDSRCDLEMLEDRSVTAAFGLRQHTLEVLLSGSGEGSVTSDLPGVDCAWDGETASGACEAVFDWGTEIRLTAREAPGSSLGSWSEPGCSGLVCDLTLTADRTVSIRFDDIPDLTLSVVGLGNGDGTVTSTPGGIDCRITDGRAVSATDCSAVFPQNATVTLTAEPEGGSSFEGWGEACSGSQPCEVTVTQSTLVAARFELEARTVTVLPAGEGSGRVESTPAGIDCEIVDGDAVGPTCSAAFDHGTELRLTAESPAGSAFAGWTGPCGGTGDCVFDVTEDVTVTARFELGEWALTVDGDGSGVGSVTGPGITCSIADGVTSNDCQEVFEHGEMVTLLATPGADTRFVGWSGACTGPDAECTLTMDQNATVTAVFARRHTLSVSLDGSGSGTVTSSPAGIACELADGTTSGDCEADFDEGVPIVLTAAGTGASGLAGWQGCDAENGVECTVTLTSPREVTATFEDPELRLSTGAVTAAATRLGDDPRERRVRVYNIGGGEIADLEATMDPVIPWLDLSWLGGSNVADPTATLEVQPRTGDLTLGTRSTTVTVSGTGVTSRSFDVEFEVIRGTTAEAAAENVRMHGLSGQAGIQYDTAYVTIRNGGRARLTDLTATKTSSVPATMEVDLDFIPSADAPTELRIIGGCDFSEEGFCEANVEWQGSGIAEQSIFVDYTFNPDPMLRVEPQGLTLTAFEGGPPVSASVNMINMNPTADGTLENHRLVPSDPVLVDEWLTAERSGTAVTITADPAGLSAETSLEKQVTVEADKTENQTGTETASDALDVRLVVQRGLEVSLAQADLYVPEGGAAEQVEVELSNGSAVSLVGLAVQSSEPWLEASLGGAVQIQPATGAVTLTLTADPTSEGLVPGTHSATVTVSSTTPGTPDETITVQVHVF